MSDYSACVTVLVRGNRIYVLDVFRRRMNFPKLMNQVSVQARRWGADVLLIEDKASGIELIQALKSRAPAGVPTPIARKAVEDKKTRAAGQTHRIEAGDLVLPTEADWLAEFEHELLGFPKARHDDQVDALIHLIAWTANGNGPIASVLRRSRSVLTIRTTLPPTAADTGVTGPMMIGSLSTSRLMKAAKVLPATLATFRSRDPARDEGSIKHNQ